MGIANESAGRGSADCREARRHCKPAEQGQLSQSSDTKAQAMMGNKVQSAQFEMR